MMTGLVPRHHGARDNAIFRLGSSPATLASLLKARGYATAAAVGAAVLDRRTGIGRGFDAYDDKVRIRSRSEFNFEERAAQSVVEAARAELLHLKSPYFLWVHFYDAHHPYVPPPPYDTRFKDRPYDGEIAYVDAQVARLLDILTKRGDAPSTIVIVAGDHGEGLGEHGEDRHDVFVYDATQRVPFFLNGPGVPAGKRIDRAAGLVDLMPTALELLGIPRPAGLDGVSLAPRMAPSSSPASSGGGEAASTPDYEMESFFPAYSYNWSPPLALVSGKWKYIGAPRPELYDLDADPRETRDLLADAAKAALPAEALAAATRLSAALRARYRGDDPARAFGAPACASAIEPGCTEPTPATAASSGTTKPPSGAPADDDAEQRERLAALGYVGGSVAPGSVPPAGPHLDPKDGIAFQRDLDRARVLAASGKPREAIKILEPIAARDPRNFPVISSLASALLGAGEYDRGIEMHRRNVAARPDYELSHSNLAGALRGKAASLDGATQGVPGTKGVVPAASALRDEGAKEYEQALRLNSRDSESYLGLANLELERAQPQAAASVLQRAVVAQAMDPEIYVLLGRIKGYLGDQDGARSAFNQALGLEERSAEAHQALGQLDFSAGDPKSAEAHYARALALAPSADIARTLGAIRLNALNDRPGALAAFRRALQLLPEGGEAQEMRDMIKDLESGP
jgi:choline-sulfatase